MVKQSSYVVRMLFLILTIHENHLNTLSIPRNPATTFIHQPLISSWCILRPKCHYSVGIRPVDVMNAVMSQAQAGAPASNPSEV